MFAISAVRDAAVSDGHIRLPPWVPLGSIVIVAIVGVAGIFACFRSLWQKF
jgi:hypothetical protein